jgi:hypothetical protein
MQITFTSREWKPSWHKSFALIMKNLLFVSILLCLSASAQISKEPLLNLLGQSVKSKDVQALLGDKKSEWTETSQGDSKLYTCTSRGIQIITNRDTVNGVVTYRGGEFLGNTWAPYRGQLPYGLRMDMTRQNIEEVLGEPERNEFSEDDYSTEENSLYPDKHLEIFYNMGLDIAGHGIGHPEDPIDMIVISKDLMSMEEVEE